MRSMGRLMLAPFRQKPGVEMPTYSIYKPSPTEKKKNHCPLPKHSSENPKTMHHTNLLKIIIDTTEKKWAAVYRCFQLEGYLTAEMLYARKNQRHGIKQGQIKQKRNNLCASTTKDGKNTLHVSYDRRQISVLVRACWPVPKREAGRRSTSVLLSVNHCSIYIRNPRVHPTTAVQGGGRSSFPINVPQPTLIARPTSTTDAPLPRMEHAKTFFSNYKPPYPYYLW